MAKRFTDTEKWKKSFLRGLDGAYKLLWLYILDDCDMAGIWQVDLEVARIRIGEQVDGVTALRAFGDRVVAFDGGKKWFVRDFIFFQYGELRESNRMHLAVINTLKKNNLDFPQGASEGLPSPQGQGQGKRQGNGQGQGIGGVGDFEKTWVAAFDENQVSIYAVQFPGVSIENELKIFRIKCDGDQKEYYGRDMGGLRNGFLRQLTRGKGANGQTLRKGITADELRGL